MTAGLREVRLVGFPLALHQRSVEHHEELLREFRLLALEPARGPNVPRRLVALVAELTEAYRGVSDAGDAERDAAYARGEESVDLVYRVPEEAAEACLRLDAMLDEADDFCRGDHLLTLAPPAETVAFRKWYLREFASQVAGAAPTPWPQVSASSR